MKIKLYTLLISFLLIANAYSQRINVGIFYDNKVTSFSFQPQAGAYRLMVDSTVIINKITKDNPINIIQSKDSITIKSDNIKIGTYSNITISGISDTNYFKITPISPVYNARIYDDGLHIYVNNGKMQIVNSVEMDNYLAGVVQSEGGGKAHIEYYKCQAIICRTYALLYINKHFSESFNLCDKTHCQAYNGKCLKNKDILEAAKLTSGLVIVDTTLNLIISTFHSNCGGETAFSEDVWAKPKTYLKSVNDPYCVNSLNAKWEKTISKDDWKKYLLKNGFKIKDTSQIANNFSFIQQHRTMYYKCERDSIPLTKIRADLNLRSTYFTIEHIGNTVILKGKGYGHGVGLCQEGAMQMANQGVKYMDIIKYYYKNIYIVSTRTLQFGK